MTIETPVAEQLLSDARWFSDSAARSAAAAAGYADAARSAERRLHRYAWMAAVFAVGQVFAAGCQLAGLWACWLLIRTH
jgi:hypothetical protein